MTTIPANLSDFLFWVKEQTELFWSIDPKTSTNDFVCEEWAYGAKWIGLTDEQIDQVEAKYEIRFLPEHREFLRILHTIDRRERIEYEDDDEIVVKERPFFYNWLEDEAEIKRRLNWPFETIFEDVEGANKFWLKSWGVKPKTYEEKKEIFTRWYNQAPKLLPLTSHRFIVSDPNLQFRPVLSVYGSDTIVYGWDLRTYLLNELQDHLNVYKAVFDEEDDCYYAELEEEAALILKNDNAYNEAKIIPYWQDVILYWSSGWSSFGLEFPRKNGDLIQPIVKADQSEDDENEQKTFTGF